MAQDKPPSDIKDQIHEALRQSAKKANAMILRRRTQEDELWVAEQAQRVLAFCREADETSETMELVFLQHNPPDDTEKRRLTMLSQTIGIDLNKLPVKPASYSDLPGPFSIQTTLMDLLELVGLLTP